MKPKELRKIPAVEMVLQALGEVDLPRPALVALVRRELAQIRRRGRVPSADEVVGHIREAVTSLWCRRLQPVINGTGVVIHTNLGRAPLGRPVMQALERIGANYNTLEFDLARGERGGRAAYLEHNLAVLCGAEAALVTNNCAGALVLILHHVVTPARSEVLISRGELIQIGGGFRIPEILEASGASLREVGTTNQTRLGDYARAVSRRTALILKVHRSNFFMSGFVESTPTAALAQLARRKRVPLVEDLGSGAMVATQQLGDLDHEPTPAEVLHQGVDLVCFSGDKLLGGPQAGIVAGRARQVAALRHEPLFRALRCDKLILAALEVTVDLYLRGAAERPTDELPVLELLRLPTEALRERALAFESILRDLPLDIRVGVGKAQVGGGTLPRSALPSVTLALRPRETTLDAFGARLRAGSPAVIGYPSAGWFKVDLRTVFPRQDPELAQAIRGALATAR
jgi:L-seryl-tRNA(Ser) seleniumtransferase